MVPLSGAPNAVADPRGGSGVLTPPPQTLSVLTKEIKGLCMTINWLIFKNELRPLTKYKTCSNLYFFCDNPLMTPLMVGSAGKSVVPGDMAPTQPMTSFFQPVTIKQSKRLKP